MFLRVLVMDSDVTSRRQLRQTSTAFRRWCRWGNHNPAEAIEAAKKGADIAIIEVTEGPGETQCLDCINHLLRLAPGISVIASGSGDSADLVIRAIRAGAIEFLRRPSPKTNWPRPSRKSGAGAGHRLPMTAR